MRLAWYVGVSTALAAGVTISAFQQRVNFYSAMVHLAQSNLCLLVLINYVYILYGFLVYGLQRLLFGPLRPSEVESLSENAWFAITETCLAMTTFRDEMGAWFLVMFTALVTGKVWGWIGDGRIEVLEQQPPANPRLFHARLVGSLLVSFVYDVVILRYTAATVIQQARPNMMVMFVFEFAILAACSARTLCRYCLTVVELAVTRRQTRQRVEDRRRQIAQERARIMERRALDPDAPEEPLPDETIDEMEIEVQGWEAKGQWVLFLELVMDCLKLCIYLAFFFILLAFYGLPIHIMRDLFMTARSFVKSFAALFRYRKALQELRVYPDAVAEDLARDPTCIICREEMQPWDPAAGSIERYRAKKLQCGHILHLGCLKSWLERQQVCPTCRRPVAVRNEAAEGGGAGGAGGGVGGGGGGGGGGNAMFGGRVRLNFGFPAEAAAPAAAAGGAQGERDAAAAPAADNGIRIINIGPVRVGFARGNAAANLVAAATATGAPHAQQQQQQQQADAARLASRRSRSTRSQIAEIDARIQAEIQTLQGQQHELQVLLALNSELRRIRHLNRSSQALGGADGGAGPSSSASAAAPAPAPATASTTSTPIPFVPPPFPYTSMPPPPSGYPLYPAYPPPPRINTPSLTRYWSQGTGVPAGSPDLPEGVVLPPGWSLVPLSRPEGGAPQQQQQQQAQAQAQSQAQTQPGAPAGTQDGGSFPPTEGEQPARQPTPGNEWFSFSQPSAGDALAASQGQSLSSPAAAAQPPADAAPARSTTPPPPPNDEDDEGMPRVVAPNPVSPQAWAATHPSVASLENAAAEGNGRGGEGGGGGAHGVEAAHEEQRDDQEAGDQDKGKARAVEVGDVEDEGPGGGSA